MTEELKNNSLDALEAALMGPSFDVNSSEQIAVKAEDVQQGGIDYSMHFFEPRVGETYLVKFLPNVGGELITHRQVYKNLPDPQRKGKSFHYISSGNAKTCPALELFFELNQLKKAGDAVAAKKIEKYMSRTNQGCCKVQILSSPKKEEIGQIRLLVFATFGPNATVANLLNQKMNPTKEQIEQGFEREDVFNIFESSVMSIVCKEAVYDGQKGRSFEASVWAPKKRGAIAVMPDGSTHEFSLKDKTEDGKLTEDATPFFKQFAQNLSSPDVDVFTWFSYKTPDDPRLDKETAEYVKNVFAKLNEIVPVIREKSLADIAKYGKTEGSSDAKSTEGKNDNGNVLQDSIPDELKGSAMAGGDVSNDAADNGSTGDADVDSILNS